MPDADKISALPEISISDLEAGDILFFSKKCPMQNMFWAVKDTWLHTAMLVERNGVLQTAEVGTKPEVYSRPISEAVGKYELTAVGRPSLSEACVAAAASWADAQVGEDQNYAWDDFVLAALVAVTRKGLPAGMLDDLGSVLVDVADNSDDIGDSSRTCAGFVHEAFARQGSPCTLVINPTDTRRLAFAESVPSADDGLLDVPLEAQEAMLAERTLYEMVHAGQIGGYGTEGINGSYISPAQMAGALRTAVRIVDGFLDRNEDQDFDGGIPGCWASPTDLWRSDQVVQHARIKL